MYECRLCRRKFGALMLFEAHLVPMPEEIFKQLDILDGLDHNIFDVREPMNKILSEYHTDPTRIPSCSRAFKDEDGIWRQPGSFSRLASARTAEEEARLMALAAEFD